MYIFIEKGLRGGDSYIARKYSKANTKYTENYGPKKPSTFITYLNTNVLYGWVMSEYLPYGKFKWLKIVDRFNANLISKKKKLDLFLKLILNVLTNYMNYKMIIH